MNIDSTNLLITDVNLFYAEKWQGKSDLNILLGVRYNLKNDYVLRVNYISDILKDLAFYKLYENNQIKLENVIIKQVAPSSTSTSTAYNLYHNILFAETSYNVLAINKAFLENNYQ